MPVAAPVKLINSSLKKWLVAGVFLHFTQNHSNKNYCNYSSVEKTNTHTHTHTHTQIKPAAIAIFKISAVAFNFLSKHSLLNLVDGCKGCEYCCQINTVPMTE